MSAGIGWFGAVLTWLVAAIIAAEPVQGQTGGRAGKPSSRSARKAARSKAVNRDPMAADRVVFKDGKELLGQVIEASPGGPVRVVVRREWAREHLPDRLERWGQDERPAIGQALEQRRARLALWREQRAGGLGQGDRISAWLERQLDGAKAGAEESSKLVMASIPRGEIERVERRSGPTGRDLRLAWILDLKDPEAEPPASIREAILARGMGGRDGDEVEIDGMLPPTTEPEGRWRIRRGATEAIHDDGVRFIQFGTTLLPEPVPGQAPDPSVGPRLLEGTIRDALGAGGANPLPAKLREVAARGRMGSIVTAVTVAPDFSGVMAESSLYILGPDGWDRFASRNAELRVGTLPPPVANLVASDPQVRSILDFVDAIGGGLIPPEVKARGLDVGATAGGAAVLSRAALVMSLRGIAFDPTEKGGERATRSPAAAARPASR